MLIALAKELKVPSIPFWPLLVLNTVAIPVAFGELVELSLEAFITPTNKLYPLVYLTSQYHFPLVNLVVPKKGVKATPLGVVDTIFVLPSENV